MTEPVPPLDPFLLDALRVESPPPGGARSRVRARLEAILPEMRRGSGGGQNGAGGDGAALLGAAGSNFAVVAAFIAGGLTGAALLAALAGGRPARIVYVDRPVSSTMVSLAGAPSTTESGDPVGGVDPALSLPAPKLISLPVLQSKGAVHSAPAPISHVSRFAAERALLDEARADLLQGEPDGALDRLRFHRANFPNGSLIEERDAMQIEALVQLRHYDEARSLARKFGETSPDSLFLPTVDSAILAIP